MIKRNVVWFRFKTLVHVFLPCSLTLFVNYTAPVCVYVWMCVRECVCGCVSVRAWVCAPVWVRTCVLVCVGVSESTRVC